MKEKSTDELNKQLENTKPDKLDSYYKKNSEYMINGENAFNYFVKDVLERKNIQLKDIYLAADMTESYAGQIIRMEKHTKNRDTILKLCIAGHFLLDEINRALKLYGMTELYAKDPRDACIIVAINNRIYDLHKIDELLEKQGFQKLLKNKKS